MMNLRVPIYPALIAAALFGSLAACNKKQNSNSDSGCITRVIATTVSQTLNASQIDSIEVLFNKNNLSTAQLQFLYFVPNAFSDTTLPAQTQVTAEFFLNKLPVFGYNEYFIFNNAIFDTAYLYTGIPQNNDSSGHQTLSYLRDAFMKHVSESVFYSPLFTKPFVPSASLYLDSCLTATLGYIDASSVKGSNAIWGKTLVKVWSVTCNNHYPGIFVEDDNGLAWGVPQIIP
ncbi:MAG: hypothetical protein JST58_08400 [Bacteroidetes bacterium]|nr:hypothetical protein [Bacteroidota bacterium]